jgi:hypothetical protein
MECVTGVVCSSPNCSTFQTLGQHPPEFVGPGPAHRPVAHSAFGQGEGQSVGSPVVPAEGLCQPLGGTQASGEPEQMRGQPQASERCTGKKVTGADRRK